MWTLDATTLDGVQVAEIDNASNREISDLLSRTNTASFQVPSSSPLTQYLASTNILIRAWFGSTLRFNGRVISYNRVANEDGRSMAVVAADPSWAFPKRRVGKNAQLGRVFPSQDSGLTAKTMIDEANAESDLHIRTGVLPYLSGSGGVYVSGPFKPLSEALADVSLGQYGFDWRIVPITYSAGKWADWLAAPIIGQLSRAVFHYVEGGGGNMKSITDSVEKTTQATRVYHYTEFSQDGTFTPIITSADVSERTTDGLYEDVAQAQLYDAGLRQNLVNAHVALRKRPRRIVTFEPQDHDPLAVGNAVPVFGVDYNVGDVVRARAEDEHGLWFDAYFRVYGYTASPTNEGLETGQVLLVDEGGSAGV